MYFYTNASNEAPKLKNEYGSLNNVINYILDGGAQHKINKIENFSANKSNTIKIYYNAEVCPFVPYQTIDVSGSVIPEYNTSFFIESINSVDRYIIAYKSSITPTLPDDTETQSLNMKIHNAGFTRKFGGISDKVTIIKFSNGMQFRIDDRDIRELNNPPIAKTSANENWYKVARITMSPSFDSLHSSLVRTYPDVSSRPDQVFNMVNNHFCPAYIRYTKINTEYYLTTTSTLSGNGETPYKIFANDKCIYIILSHNDDNRWKFVYVIGTYEALNPEVVNGYMFTMGYNGEGSGDFTTVSNYSSGTYPYNDITNLLYVNETSDRSMMELHTHSVVYDNGNGTYDWICRSPELYICPTLSGLDYGRYMSYPNKINNAVYFSDVLLSSGKSSSDKTYYGKLYDIKWACNNLGNTTDKDGTLYEIDGDMYYEYVHSCRGSSSYLTHNYIKLTR